MIRLDTSGLLLALDESQRLSRLCRPARGGVTETDFEIGISLDHLFRKRNVGCAEQLQLVCATSDKRFKVLPFD